MSGELSQTAMSNADDPPSPTASVPASRGFRALLRNLRRHGGTGESERSGKPERADAKPAQLDLVDQAHAFQTVRVSQLMTPRTDISGIEITEPFAGVVARFVESEHSRMPIYRGTMDDPLGVIHIKDIFKLLSLADPERPGPGAAVLDDLRRETLYVPASMRAADLLVRMRSSRIHMALVIDEFGGTDGLVTLEDLIEAVVGDIDDEYDEAEAPEIVERPPGVFEADGRTPLEVLETAVGAVLTPEDLEEEIDTAAGLVTTLAGRVPQRGEVIAHPGGFEIEITDADPRRVKRIRLRRLQGSPPTPIGA
jgi:CBS domain containing-hemolysin-like protein